MDLINISITVSVVIGVIVGIVSVTSRWSRDSCMLTAAAAPTALFSLYVFTSVLFFPKTSGHPNPFIQALSAMCVYFPGGLIFCGGSAFCASILARAVFTPIYKRWA